VTDNPSTLEKYVIAAQTIDSERAPSAIWDPALSRSFFDALLTSGASMQLPYHKQRARGVDHHAALRQLANRLDGILHGCLKTRTLYDETTAWSHQSHDQQPAA
jgi:hypothetical protein